MPGKLLILNSVGIFLQYSLVVLLYYFLFKVARMAYIDLAGRPVPPLREHVPAKPQEILIEEEARLVVVDAGPLKLDQAVYPIGETIAIGRSEGNEIIINDSFVSQEHACITRYKQGFWLADLHSTNGTCLNKRQVTEEVPLQNGDLITIGAVTFRFER